MKHRVLVPAEHKELTAIHALALNNQIDETKVRDELVIDLCHVQYISAAGIGVIVDACLTFKQVYLLNVSEKLLNVFNITGIDNYAKFEEDGKSI